eukprot:3492-Eustigmatos_ZCMA.PRE.1
MTRKGCCVCSGKTRSVRTNGTTMLLDMHVHCKNAYEHICRRSCRMVSRPVLSTRCTLYTSRVYASIRILEALTASLPRVPLYAYVWIWT